MSHTVANVSPIPISLPNHRARPPVKTTRKLHTVNRTPVVTVTAIRTGHTHHTGRPSGTSWIVFDARIKAPTYPDADHSAAAKPTIAKNDAVDDDS